MNLRIFICFYWQSFKCCFATFVPVLVHTLRSGVYIASHKGRPINISSDCFVNELYTKYMGSRSWKYIKMSASWLSISTPLVCTIIHWRVWVVKICVGQNICQLALFPHPWCAYLYYNATFELVYSYTIQVTFQYAIWDKLKIVDTLTLIQCNNLCQFLVHMIGNGAMSIAVLRVSC